MRWTILAILALILVGSMQATQAQEMGRPDREIAIERFDAVREILDEAAEARAEARRGDDRGLIGSLLRSSPEDRARSLLDEAFSIVADTEITGLQRETEEVRARIRQTEEEIARLREDLFVAPAEVAAWEDWLEPTSRSAIEEKIAGLEGRIEDDRAALVEIRGRFIEAMRRTGVEIGPDEADLLLEGVTGGDVVSIAAAYDVVGRISGELRAIMRANGEDLPTARRYYTLHTTLIALLAEAQRSFVEKVEREYLPRLDAIQREIASARADTETLLGERPSPEHRRTLEANRESQRLAAQAAELYRAYLEEQRDEVAVALARTLRDLRVADNTLRTVEASFQLLEVMRAAKLEFETLGTLEAPGLDTIFRNEALRREFESLSDRLRAPSS